MGDIDDILLAVQAATVGGAGAVQGVRERRSTQDMIRQARGSLAAMDLPEAAEIADMLGRDPRAANKYVLTRYGSWPEMYKHLHKQSEERSAASALRAAGGSADVPEYIRQRREFAAGMYEAGETPTAAQMTALFPGAVSPSALGLDPQQWTGESINKVLNSYMQTGVPDFSLLRPRETAAGAVPEGMKIPVGHFYDPKDPKFPVKPIPGTKAETDWYLNQILTQMLVEGATNDIHNMQAYFEAHPEQKAFFFAKLRQMDKENPLLALLLPAIESATAGGTPSPPKKPTFPQVPPSGRSNLRR